MKIPWQLAVKECQQMVGVEGIVRPLGLPDQQAETLLQGRSGNA